MAGRPRTVSDDEIHAVVARLVSEVGPSGLTLAAVGRRAGLSPAGLVQRFGSKRGLLLAFAAQAADHVHVVFDRAEASSRSPVGALHRAHSLLVAGIDGPEALANNLAFLQVDLTDPDFRAHARRHSREVRQRLRALLDSGVTEGDLSPGIDTRTLAQHVHTTYNGALLTWAVDGRGRLDRWVRRHVDATLAPHLAGPRGR